MSKRGRGDVSYISEEELDVSDWFSRLVDWHASVERIDRRVALGQVRTALEAGEVYRAVQAAAKRLQAGAPIYVDAERKK